MLHAQARNIAILDLTNRLALLRMGSIEDPCVAHADELIAAHDGDYNAAASALIKRFTEDAAALRARQQAENDARQAAVNSPECRQLLIDEQELLRQAETQRSKAKLAAAEYKAKQRSLEDAGLTLAEIKELLGKLPGEQEYREEEAELLKQAVEIRGRRVAMQIPLAELRQDS